MLRHPFKTTLHSSWLATHRCLLRLHSHLAAQHAGGRNRIVDCNQAALALAGKPVGDAFAGGTDCALLKGLGDLWKSFAFSNDQPIDPNDFLVAR